MLADLVSVAGHIYKHGISGGSAELPVIRCTPTNSSS
jgi:hypothetical protein